jgi:hypothetical protein
MMIKWIYKGGFTKMSNTKAPEGSPEPVTTAEKPILPVVQPSPGKPGSESGSIDATALEKRIYEQVKGDLSREIREAQSDKDRRLKDYDKDKARIDKLFAYFQKFPDNPDQAKREYRIDQLLEGQEEPISSRVDVGNVKPKGLEERALDVLAKSKITDPNEQLEIRREWAKSAPPGGFDSDDDAVAAMGDFIAEYKIAKSKRDAPASAATAIAPIGGVQVPEDLATISARLIELQKGNLNDPANQAARAALLDKIRKLRSNS